MLLAETFGLNFICGKNCAFLTFQFLKWGFPDEKLSLKGGQFAQNYFSCKLFTERFNFYLLALPEAKSGVFYWTLPLIPLGT